MQQVTLKLSEVSLTEYEGASFMFKTGIFSQRKCGEIVSVSVRGRLPWNRQLVVEALVKQSTTYGGKWIDERVEGIKDTFRFTISRRAKAERSLDGRMLIYHGKRQPDKDDMGMWLEILPASHDVDELGKMFQRVTYEVNN